MKCCNSNCFLLWPGAGHRDRPLARCHLDLLGFGRL